MKKNFIVDGFNLGYKIPSIARWIASGKTDYAIQLIINHIQKSIGLKAEQIIIVFDGQYEGSKSTAKQGKILIKFSKKPQTADDIIRDFIRHLKKTSDWVVISADNEIINTAKAMGVEIMPANDLNNRDLKPGQTNNKERDEKYNPRDIDIDYWLKKFDE